MSPRASARGTSVALAVLTILTLVGPGAALGQRPKAVPKPVFSLLVPDVGGRAIADGGHWVVWVDHAGTTWKRRVPGGPATTLRMPTTRHPSSPCYLVDASMGDALVLCPQDGSVHTADGGTVGQQQFVVHLATGAVTELPPAIDYDSAFDFTSPAVDRALGAVWIRQDFCSHECGMETLNRFTGKTGPAALPYATFFTDEHSALTNLNATGVELDPLQFPEGGSVQYHGTDVAQCLGECVAPRRSGRHAVWTDSSGAWIAQLSRRGTRTMRLRPSTAITGASRAGVVGLLANRIVAGGVANGTRGLYVAPWPRAWR